MCSSNKKTKIYNDSLQNIKNSIKNQFFIIPIYRRISDRSCYNLLEIFFILTSFSFDNKFDYGECGLTFEGGVFFISDYSKLFSRRWLIFELYCRSFILLRILLMRSSRDFPYFCWMAELGEMALYLRIDLWRMLSYMIKILFDFLCLKLGFGWFGYIALL